MVGALDADGTLAARWSLGFEDMALLNSKPANANLGLALQLMFYRATGRFGRAASACAPSRVSASLTLNPRTGPCARQTRLCRPSAGPLAASCAAAPPCGAT